MNLTVELSKEELKEIINALKVRSYNMYHLIYSEDLPFPYKREEIDSMEESMNKINELSIRLQSSLNKNNQS
jgi:hypothetical protein